MTFKMIKIQFLHGSLATGSCPMALREAFDGQAVVPTPDLPLRSTTVHIETYKPEYRDDFIRLNREWIETCFRIEASDIETFSHVDEIVEQGGQIFLAITEGGEVVGCCALKHHREKQSYELAKMAVSPHHQGKHIGHKLGEAVIEYAKKYGIDSIYLEGNTRLKASIALYRSLGFVEIPLRGDAYERCDILMEYKR